MSALKIYNFIRDQLFSYCSGESKVSVCEGEGEGEGVLFSY